MQSNLSYFLKRFHVDRAVWRKWILSTEYVAELVYNKMIDALKNLTKSMMRVHPKAMTLSLLLVHAFITSRVDYSNCLLAGVPRSTTEKLQRIMNPAAWLIINTRKFDRWQYLGGSTSPMSVCCSSNINIHDFSCFRCVISIVWVVDKLQFFYIYIYYCFNTVLDLDCLFNAWSACYNIMGLKKNILSKKDLS